MRSAAHVALVFLAAFGAAAGGASAGVRVSPVASIEEGLLAPTSLCVSPDQVAVLEPYASRLLVYTADGRLDRRVDLSRDASGLVRWSAGEYASCDRAAGAVFVIGTGEGSEPRQITPAGALADPMDLMPVAGGLWVLDAGSAEVVMLDAAGTVAGRRPLVDETGLRLGYPVSMDRFAGELYVFDQATSRIHVYAADGAHARSFCSFGAGAATVTRGGCLRVDARGLVFVTDRFQGRVAVFRTDGAFLGHLDPAATAGRRLSIPFGLGLDAGGLLYVASAEARRIDLFQVEADEILALPMAIAVGPTGDGVRPEDVVLRIEAIADTSRARDVVADFRLWHEDDPANPVASVDGVATTVFREAGAAAATIRASWRPAVPVREGAGYRWSARLRDALGQGGWPAPWSFRTGGPAWAFRLGQNSPNPFRGATTIGFELPEGGKASLEIFDLQGRTVWAKHFDGLEPGRHELTWRSADAGGSGPRAGIYFYRLTARGRQETRTMVLAR